jgi:hypothetical protein
MLQVITGSFSLSLSSAYTQGTATNGTSYGGTGGSPNGANQNCSSGAVVAIGASKSGNNLNSFMFVCKTVNNDASLSATEATTNVFNAPSESDRCSVGQIGVGVRVIASNGGTLVGGVGLICGNPVSGGSQNTRSIMPDALSAGTVYTYTCGTGQLLAGFYLRTGALVDQLTPKCSTFSGFAYAAVGAPTATVTGNTASVSFTPVTGSTADTSLTYTVSAVPSSGSTITVTGNASPISVPNLVLRANYTVTVTASNAYGSSPSTSSASATMALPGSDTDTALSLNGSTQYADVSDTTGSPFDITGTLTLEAWVNPASSCSGNGAVISKTSYMLYCQSGVWKVMFLANGVSGSGITTNIEVRPNEWQHIAVTKSSGSGSALFYYNGVLASTIATGVTTMTPNNAAFEIGRYGAGYYFQGKIDEVRVYNSQRSVSEIAADMNSYATVADANLVAYYDLNEASGSTIYNRKTGASSSTDLTISGSATYGDVKTVDTSVAAYTIVKFQRTYITAIGGWKAPQTARSSILTVAGGGGGGARHGGGGGGGGVSYAPTYMLSSGATYEIKVGTGGFGYPAGAGTGTSGVNSTFKPSNILESITALGGGGGGGTGLSGGSSGGTNSGLTYSTVPEKTQYSTSYFVGYGNKGGQGYNGYSCGTDWCGGGGGGAGSPGGIPTTSGSTQAGNGGNGFAVAIESLTVTYYGGGGGGGSYNPTLNSTGGLGGGGAGGKNAQGANGTFALGGGGGGGGFAGGTSYGGGNGGSGVIIIRWITATAPIFTGPKFDTLTAGLTESFTVTGSATSPLTRNFRWQVSTDTGTSWSNASQGSGVLTANYVTPTLETTTSGIRYQYRVVVTDSDTAGLFIVDTSTAVYLMINPRNTITSSTGSATFTQKYGESRTAVFTFAFGTGPRTATVSSTTNNQNGKITWSNLNSDSATVRVGTALSVGTYSETLTVTDSVTAFTTQALTITVSKADTITVTTTLSSSSVTYTESPAAITTTQTVTGLVNSETATVTSTYTANSCEYGGTCAIGDVAPGGGYVFYVSPTVINVATGISSGGIYLATAPQTWGGGSIDPNASFGCGSTNIASTSDSVGSGAENTRLINAGCATAGIASRLAADSSAEGFTDWFIPSIDELTLIYNNLKLNSLSNLQSWNYWSSTQGTTLSYGKYWWFGSGAVSGQTDKNNSAASNMYVRPIRAFSPTALASNTVPTDAGVYKVGSTFAISSPASLSNYQGVESVTATLTINKANQKAITIGQYLAYPNISSYPLNVYGGSGPGVLTRTLVSAGSAGCSLASSFILTATSVGSCTVKAEKAGTRNYIVESTTATIYWIAWLDNYAAQTLGGNNVIPLAGGNQIIVRTETLTASAFSNTSGGAITSAAVGATIRINSTGFSGLTPSNLSVTFRPYEDAVVSAVTSTYVEVVIPAGATTGVIAIDSVRGVAYTQSFTISP